MSRIERYIANVERQLTLQTGLKSLGVGLALGVFSLIFYSSLISFLAVFGVGFIVFGYFIGLFGDKRNSAIQVLHARFSDLEFSLQLLDKPSRNVAEQLQWERINASFRGGEVRLWYQNTGAYVVGLLLSIGIYGLSFLHQPSENPPSVQTNRKTETSVIPAEYLPVQMSSTAISITPPTYTGLPKVTQSTLDVKAITGSDIEWNITFSTTENLTVELVSSSGDGLEFTHLEDRFVLRDRVKNSGIYAVRTIQNGIVVFESDYHRLEVVPDLAPVIQPEKKELYSYHFIGDPQSMDVRAKVSDDFEVREVFLVATLARGTGENVKFRENRIPIARQNFKSEELSVKLDLKALDFKPGDELYYYWAAIDNRTPEPNLSRSDTYFVNYVDSAGMTEETLIGMAIHVMPEYFRSQRQIIIDTEKLLADQKKMTEQEFNAISNEIGHDQKMLRLRYGQYLGEEFEESAGGGSVDQGDVENLLEGYEHRHDEEHEAGITANVFMPKHDHDHDHEASHATQSNSSDDDGGLGGLLDSYLHNHEDAEANTYFEESTKATLKQALAQMWQSELHLRLFEPDEALQYQEKALEYLKSVQQKSRVYVKRTGFDPPPIKEEEKRLTGDLEELKKQIEIEQLALANKLAPLAAQVLGMLHKERLSATDKATIQQLGELWTTRMNYSGLQEWAVLLHLQELNSGKLGEEGKKELYQKFHPLIARSEGANASFLKQKELVKAFWNKLQ
ncbi:hypothetical protein [Algoriphagus sp. NG3]|uniref:hypothetical protein n=1 Tax=Algoriphagus sp. NG3 TaxID=3097546 RepID=UPI002A808ECA|nr:hypothetical protein [Algoriphagus sp. NG3]WPR76226.1 hypothetical protein SLW71_02560 [Algoriphagus sp. NG3]